MTLYFVAVFEKGAAIFFGTYFASCNYTHFMKLFTFSYFFIFLLAFNKSNDAAAQGWQWARGNTGDGMDGWAVATDVSGNVFAAGIDFGYSMTINFGTKSISAPYGSSIIAKYDGAGNILWANYASALVTPSDSSSLGGTWLYNIATDMDGNALMFGSYNSKSLKVGALTLTNSIVPQSQYFLVKYSPSGLVLWAVNGCNSSPTFATAGAISYVLSTGGVAADDAGNVYVTSYFSSPTTNVGSVTLTNSDPSGLTSDIYVVKYDPSGNLIWARNFGGNGNDEAYGITVTHLGDIYIAGDFGSGFMTFGTSTISNAALAGGKTGFIARLNSSGNGVWASASGGNGNDYAVGLASDIDNNVFLTGGFKEASISFSGTAISNPTPGDASLYLVKFDPSNNVVWNKTICEKSPVFNGGAWGYSIAVSQCGLVWVSGALTDSVIIDGHVLRKPVNSIDPIFVAAYTTGGTYVDCAALSSGGDDQNGIAADPMGNIYMCSDYQCKIPFIAGPDTLPADSNGELLFVAKYPYQKIVQNVKSSVQLVCVEKELKLSAAKGFAHYVWSTGATTDEITYSGGSGVVYVYGFDSCAASETDSFIIGETCTCGLTLYVPNLFTPNGDGQNDVFFPRGGNEISLVKSFRVYDRWGEVVFEKNNIAINDAANAWDGKYKGMDPRPDVFVWTAEIQCNDGKTTNHKGNVTIMR